MSLYGNGSVFLRNIVRNPPEILFLSSPCPSENSKTSSSSFLFLLTFLLLLPFVAKSFCGCLKRSLCVTRWEISTHAVIRLPPVRPQIPIELINDLPLIYYNYFEFKRSQLRTILYARRGINKLVTWVMSAPWNAQQSHSIAAPTHRCMRWSLQDIWGVQSWRTPKRLVWVTNLIKFIVNNKYVRKTWRRRRTFFGNLLPQDNSE